MKGNQILGKSKVMSPPISEKKSSWKDGLLNKPNVPSAEMLKFSATLKMFLIIKDALATTNNLLILDLLTTKFFPREYLVFGDRYIFAFNLFYKISSLKIILGYLNTFKLFSCLDVLILSISL